MLASASHHHNQGLESAEGLADIHLIANHRRHCLGEEEVVEVPTEVDCADR